MLDLKKYDKDNIFARILRKEINSKIVYENDYVLAFEDIHPVAPFHVLVIPKGEYTCYNDFINNASQEEQIAFFKAVAEISEQNDLLDGYRIVSNIGSNARQMVPHFHFHIVGKKILPHKSMEGEV